MVSACWNKLIPKKEFHWALQEKASSIHLWLEGSTCGVFLWAKVTLEVFKKINEASNIHSHLFQFNRIHLGSTDNHPIHRKPYPNNLPEIDLPFTTTIWIPAACEPNQSTTHKSVDKIVPQSYFYKDYKSSRQKVNNLNAEAQIYFFEQLTKRGVVVDGVCKNNNFFSSLHRCPLHALNSSPTHSTTRFPRKLDSIFTSRNQRL